jgi:hypothetical protein
MYFVYIVTEDLVFSFTVPQGYVTSSCQNARLISEIYIEIKVDRIIFSKYNFNDYISKISPGSSVVVPRSAYSRVGCRPFPNDL